MKYDWTISLWMISWLDGVNKEYTMKKENVHIRWKYCLNKTINSIWFKLWQSKCHAYNYTSNNQGWNIKDMYYA